MEQMDDTTPDMAANAAMGLPEVHEQSVTLTSKSVAHHIV